MIKLILLLLLSLFLVNADTVLYSTGTLLSGGGLRGSRTISTDYCKSLTFYNQLNCSSAYALLTYSVTDQLSNLPINQSAVVVGPNDDIIAYNWTLFLNGMLVKTLGFASVTNNDYWLGDFTSNCDQWTTSSRCLNAVYGKPNWPFLSYGKTGCSNLKSVVCVCDAGTVLGTPGPTTNAPSGSPSRLPTVAPSLSPSTHPTTLQPSKLPTTVPSTSPSQSPTIRLESDLLTFYAQENQLVPISTLFYSTFTSAVEYSSFSPFLTDNGTVIKIRQPGNYLLSISLNIEAVSSSIFIPVQNQVLITKNDETVFYRLYSYWWDESFSQINYVYKNVLLNLQANDTIRYLFAPSSPATIINGYGYIKEIKDLEILVFNDTFSSTYGINPPDIVDQTVTINREGLYEVCNNIDESNTVSNFNILLNNITWISYQATPTPNTASIITPLCNVGYLEINDKITFPGISSSYDGFVRYIANSVVSTWSVYNQLLTNSSNNIFLNTSTGYGIAPPDTNTITNLKINNDGVYMVRFSTSLLTTQASIYSFDSVNKYDISSVNGQNLYSPLVTDTIISADNISFAGEFSTTSTILGANYGRCYAIKLFDNVAETCHAVSISNDNCLKRYLSAWRAVPSETLYLLLTSDSLDCSSDGQQNTNLGLGSAISRFKLSENEYNYSCYYVAEQGSPISGPFTTSPTPYTTATIAPTTSTTITNSPTVFEPYLQIQSLTATTLGDSVAISGDVSTIAVGNIDISSFTGGAAIYVRSGITWTQQGSILTGTGSVFSSTQGRSVSLSFDGNTFALGGDGDNSNVGATWIFTRNASGVWEQQGSKLVGSGSIGASQQGNSVALSADGNTLVIGAPGDNSLNGAVWVFVRSGTTWSQQGSKLTGSDADIEAEQGRSVSISADGNTLIFGGNKDSTEEGAVWVFIRNGTTWQQQGLKLTGCCGVFGGSQQGWSVSLSADGTTFISGGYTYFSNTGGVWVFTKNSSNVWNQQGSVLVGGGAVSESSQGWSVSLSADGNTFVSGGRRDDNFKGAIWVFTKTGSSWTQLGSKITQNTGDDNDQFGYAVAIANDTSFIVVGGNDGSPAGAFVFLNKSIPSSAPTKFPSTMAPSPIPITSNYAADLSKQLVACNSTQVLSRFNLKYNPNNTIYYEYYCVSPRYYSDEWLECSSYNTSFVDYGLGIYFTQLQLLDVSCPLPGQAIQSFKLLSVNTEIAYTYTCCLPETITSSPTRLPTLFPTSKSPSQSPSSLPTSRSPSRSPTLPTSQPSLSPSSIPTSRSPSLSPSSLPTSRSPSLSPTLPTSQPSLSPSSLPTSRSPSLSPSFKPTNNPTLLPTSKSPSSSPSLRPTSKSPSLSPSLRPTTLQPTLFPTTLQPSRLPTPNPTNLPTFSPTSFVESNSMMFIFSDLQPVLADWRDLQLFGDTRIGSQAPYFDSTFNQSSTTIVVGNSGQYLISFSIVPDSVSYAGNYLFRILINGVSVYEIWSTVNVVPFSVFGYFLTDSLSAGNTIKFQQSTNSGAVRYLNPYSSRNLGYVKKSDDLGTSKWVLNTLAVASTSGSYSASSTSSVGSPGGTVSSSQFTVTDSGRYEITINVVAFLFANSVLNTTINKNGAVIASQITSTTESGSTYTPASISNIFDLVATDVIDFRYTRTTAGTLFSNFVFIRRLRSDTITTTWSITPGSPISQGVLGYAPFQPATAYGNDGVTVSTTATPTSSTAVGRITFNVAATYQVKIISNVNVKSGQFLEYSAVFSPIWDNYFPTYKIGTQPMIFDYIGYFNQSQTLNLFAMQSPTPAPATTFGNSLQTFAFATKVGNTYSDSCGPNGIISVTGDNCQTRMQTYYISTSNVDKYEITLPGLDTNCEAKGLSGNPTKGKALYGMRLFPAQSLTTPTPSPAAVQMFYMYGCRYINDRNSASYTPSSYTATPTPFTTYSPTQSRYSIDLSNQNTVDCRPYSAAISYFTLTYNGGTARIAYNFKCTPFKIPPGYYLQCTTYYTSYEDWGGGYSTVFLDRVQFSCPNPNQAVAYFLLEAVPASNLQRYQYVCCETVANTPAPTTLQPSRLPTPFPTQLPTLLPTSKSPSRSPTNPTTFSPSKFPTTVPSRSPTVFPESAFMNFSIVSGQSVASDTLLNLQQTFSYGLNAPTFSNSNRINIAVTGNYKIVVTVTIPSATSNVLDLKLVHSTTSYNCYSQMRYQTPMTNAQSISFNCVILNVPSGTYFIVQLATYGNTVTTTTVSSGYIQLLTDTGITTFTLPNNARIFNGASPGIITLSNVATSGTTSLTLASNRFTVTSAGLYEYGFSTSSQVDNVNQGAGLYVYVNGVALFTYVIGFTPNAFMYNSQVTNPIYLNLNDIIDFRWDAGTSSSVTTHGAGYNFGYLRRFNPSVRVTYANVINGSPITSPTCAGIQLDSVYYSHSNSPLITTSPTPTPTTGRVTIRRNGYYALNLNGNVRPATNNLLTYCFNNAPDAYSTKVIQTGYALNFNGFLTSATNGINITVQAGVASGGEAFFGSGGGRFAIIQLA